MLGVVRPALLVLVVLAGADCDRGVSSTSSAPEALGARELSVRVPAAIMIARGLDSVAVSVDPSSLAETRVTVAAGMMLGIEAECRVFPAGQSQPAGKRRGITSGVDFDVSHCTWSSTSDGVPVQGTKYVAEMHIVLFQTDVRAKPGWDPHAGRFEALWERALRQAEE